MKKSTLINPELSYLVATMGHTDEITVCDAGLPISDPNQRLDLALVPGIPTFLDTVKALLAEMKIEGIVLAEEFKQLSPDLHLSLIDVIREEEVKTGHKISINHISHEAFKARTQNSKAVVRTGECTPYANVIFQAGVVF
ncbi:D-ribose pyranase [Photobacterium sp. SDRW27]|uniref:D-ribose pyranase n=1 Tax=Photobacterium obscurum TaxID=2829490 RepID=UPI002244D651|nr:D-ribose pyranase [Photobacterium obscurum]MCW8327656.1 D-ribose pyranase [Photobacterium obscurum]